MAPTPLLVAALLLAAGVAQADPYDPVRIYEDLQIAQGSGFPTYELRETATGLSASPGPLYGALGRVEAMADRTNLYLRIDDLGDGEGATPFVTEMAVWIDSEGFPLVGLSERGVRNGVPFGGRVRFYSKASSRWNLVTDEVFPSLDASLCRTDPQEVAEDTSAWEGLGRAITLLPRKGTDVEVWCVAPSPVAGTGARVEWDRAAGRFKEGTRLEGSPPWPDRLAPR